MKAAAFFAITAVCAISVFGSGCATAHPDSSAAPWKALYDPSRPIGEQFDASSGKWSAKDGVLTSDKDGAIWTREDYENFALDFEYKLDPGANSGVLIYCCNTKKWIPNAVEIQLMDDHDAKWAKLQSYMQNASLYGHCAPTKQNVRKAGEWNRMTVFARGKNIQIINNGEKVMDIDLSKWNSAKTNPDGTKIPPWLNRPWAELDTKGKLGFQGKHGNAKPYFRNIRIRPL